VRVSAPALNAYIDAQLAAHGLSEDKLALVGFSQGTMMALHVGPRRAKTLAGIVGFPACWPIPTPWPPRS
jgi:phospholipase/carboxylesterase